MSILMANYNNAEYIAQAIQSVLDQNCPNWELIVVDDASTDQSVDVITSFVRDKRIKFHRNARNVGYGNTLRVAISHAIGSIIGILDSDDVLVGQAVKVMLDAYLASDAGLIYSQHRSCDGQLRRVRKGPCGPIPVESRYLDAVKNILTAELVSHFKTFKRAAYDKTAGFGDWGRTVDKDIVLKLEEVTRLKFIDRSLYLYRGNPKGISINPATPSFRKEVIAEAMARRGLR